MLTLHVAWTFLSKHRRKWLGHSCPSTPRRRGRRRQNGCDDIPVVAESLSRTIQVAWTFLSKHTLSAGTLCDAKNGVAPVAWTILSKRGSSAGTLCDAKTGATTFLSSQVSLAGTAVLRRQERRRTWLAWLGQSCPSAVRRRGRFATPRKASHLSWSSAGRRRYERQRTALARRQEWHRTCACVAWTFLSKHALSAGTLCDAKKGVAPVAWTVLSKRGSSAGTLCDATNGVAPELVVGEQSAPRNLSPAQSARQARVQLSPSPESDCSDRCCADSTSGLVENPHNREV